MANYDKTEGKLNILGFVGSIIVGLSGAAVGTWKTLKEVDKINAEKEPEVKAPTDTTTTE